MLFFYDGYFNPRHDNPTQRVFTLVKVQKRFEGLTYKTLSEHDRIRLDTSILHATTVKQNSPAGDDTSFYHIFERLNRGGRRLTDQEMRLALYYGTLIDLTKELNAYEPWRRIFGKPHSRLKDQELILRFFALYDNLEKYQRPLSEFLNKYAAVNRNPKQAKLGELSRLFRSAIDVFSASLKGRPFRLTTSLNAAIYDSCMIGLAHRLAEKPKKKVNFSAVSLAYEQLLKDKGYLEAASRSTADILFVQRRINKAINVFSDC